MTRSTRRLARSTLMRRLGRPNLERLERIGRTAIELGWQAYLVGGVVRDLLLRRPTKDLDLVVVGDARRLAREIARAEGGVYREHRAFGTASVAFEDGVRLDLATARRESYRRPAALPDVSPSDLSDDLERRDFTINSMALELAPSELGRIVDPLEGQADLRRSVIRTLHARSFIDDPTRAFRAVRFAIRLGCQIEQSTAANLRQAVRSGVFDRLSGARVQRELSLLFDERDWIDLGRSLRRFGLLRAVHPCLRPTRTEEARLERAESWAEWYASIDHSASLERWVLALASLTLTRTAEERDALVARLRPRRRDSRELLESAVASRAILETLRATGHPRPSRIYRTCESKSATSCLLALAETRTGAIRQGISAFLRDWRWVEADISGSDLMRAGVPPGPGVGVGLRAALDAKLDGRAPGRAEQVAVGVRAARAGA